MNKLKELLEQLELRIFDSWFRFCKIQKPMKHRKRSHAVSALLTGFIQWLPSLIDKQGKIHFQIPSDNKELSSFSTFSFRRRQLSCP